MADKHIFKKISPFILAHVETIAIALYGQSLGVGAYWADLTPEQRLYWRERAAEMLHEMAAQVREKVDG